jgi:hypothetical protein
MQRLQKEIYRNPECFRIWKGQGCLSEVQGQKGSAEHLRFYDQDQPEKLNVIPSPQIIPVSAFRRGHRYSPVPPV